MKKHDDPIDRLECEEADCSILVVEDDELLRFTVAEYLHQRGFEVHEAANGTEAVTVLQSGAPVDLVFSDIQMPGMNGLELARWVRANRSETLIFLTSGDSRWRESAAPLCTDRSFFGKPYDNDLIASKMQRAVAAAHEVHTS